MGRAGQARRYVAAGALALAALTPSFPAAAAAPRPAAEETTTVPPEAAPVDGATTTTTVPASTTTSTTIAPERCDPVAPKALVFVGTATVKADDSVTFLVDEVREGPPIGGQTVVVTFVRDARFFKVDERYLVTAALDPDAQLYLSKVRSRRGEDPRCVAKDPVYTTLANGTKIDTGVFSGLSGTSGKVFRAFLLPLAAVVGALLALVLVKRLLMLVGRLVARLVRGGHAPPAGR
jgi:hypothetical protein